MAKFIHSHQPKDVAAQWAKVKQADGLAFIAPAGHVIGVDMTPEMLDKAQRNAIEAETTNLEFRAGYLEALPVPDEWADVIISNSVLNLMPNKDAALAERM